jgi:hypothetical protein
MARRGRRCVAALAVAAMMTAAGAARSEPFTLDQFARMGGAAAEDFPVVLGGRAIQAQFNEKRVFTIADGTRHTMFLFRASNCWLRERTTRAGAAIDCTGRYGPGVFIPVLFLTPASRSSPRKPPDLVLVPGRYSNSLANYLPVDLLDRVPPYGNTRVIWTRLVKPEEDSINLSAPAAPAALVLCVPFAAPECMDSASFMLTNVGGSTPPDQREPPPPVAPIVPPARPPRVAAPVRPPALATPAPSAPVPPATPAPAAPVPPTTPAPAAPVPPAEPAAPPPAGPATSAPATAAREQVAPPAVPPGGQLHYVIRAAASSMVPGWTKERMAKRLLARVTSTRSQFVLKTSGGIEVHSSAQPELTRSGDGVVAWSGERPEGPAELVFRGGEGLELVARTQSSQPQPAPAALTDPHIRASDAVAFAEFRIAAPYLYDQWQARIEVVTKVYGQELADSVDDLCQFHLQIPRTGWLSFLTGPINVDLERMDEGGKRILQSQPVIMPAQLMRAAGEPLHLDIQASAADPACIAQTRKLAAFTTASGNATAAWKLSDLPGNQSVGRMEIRPASLSTRGRWLLGLYGPQNLGAGAEDASDARDQVFKSLTRFLDDFREQNFQRGRPASQAVGADLALISSADSTATAFSQRNVLIGKFRQPGPLSDSFQIDPEGRQRLSVFLSTAGNAGADVPFRSVGQMIRHYSQLFSDFSGEKPPIAIYVGAARPAADSCVEWKRMTAEAARLSGRPRVFGLVFANASSDQIGQQLGRNGRGTDEILAPGTRALTCNGDGGPSLLFVAYPDLLSHPPDTVLRPAFNVLQGWADKVQN